MRFCQCFGKVLPLLTIFFLLFGSTSAFAQTPEDQPNDGIIKKGTWLAGSSHRPHMTLIEFNAI